MQDFDNEEQVLAELKNVARKLSLEIWSEQEFREHYKKEWADVKPKPMARIIKLLASFG